jgi:hypothetical protein
MGLGYYTPERFPGQAHIKSIWASDRYADALDGVSFDDFERFYKFMKSDANPTEELWIRHPTAVDPKTGKPRRIKVEKPQYGIKDAQDWILENPSESTKAKKAILLKKKGDKKTVEVDLTGEGKPDAEVTPLKISDYERDSMKKRLGIHIDKDITDEELVKAMLDQQSRLVGRLTRIKFDGIH